jgi:hypothetical protein
MAPADQGLFCDVAFDRDAVMSSAFAIVLRSGIARIRPSAKISLRARVGLLCSNAAYWSGAQCVLCGRSPVGRAGLHRRRQPQSRHQSGRSPSWALPAGTNSRPSGRSGSPFLRSAVGLQVLKFFSKIGSFIFQDPINNKTEEAHCHNYG